MSVNPNLTCLWISTGAYIGDQRPASKSALARALADPALRSKVRFDVEAPEGSRRSGEIIPATAEDVGPSKLNVTGPDPDNNPTWWATVQVSNGRVVVA